MSSADEGAAGISASPGDEGAALQRAQDKIATMQAARVPWTSSPGPERPKTPAATPTTSSRSSTNRVAAEADKEPAALKAETGPGSPALPELAGSRGPGASAGAGHPRRLVAEDSIRPGRVAVRR